MNSIKTRHEIFDQYESTPTERSYLGTHVCSSRYCDRILDELSSNVKIIKVIPDFKKLIKYEALTISYKKPDLNTQIDNFVNPLKLFAGNYHPAPPPCTRVTPPHIRTEPIINNNTGLTIHNRYSLR